MPTPPASAASRLPRYCLADLGRDRGGCSGCRPGVMIDHEVRVRLPLDVDRRSCCMAADGPEISSPGRVGRGDRGLHARRGGHRVGHGDHPLAGGPLGLRVGVHQQRQRAVRRARRPARSACSARMRRASDQLEPVCTGTPPAGIEVNRTVAARHRPYVPACLRGSTTGPDQLPRLATSVNRAPCAAPDPTRPPPRPRSTKATPDRDDRAGDRAGHVDPVGLEVDADQRRAERAGRIHRGAGDRAAPQTRPARCRHRRPARR